MGRGSVTETALVARARSSSFLNVALATQLAQSLTRSSPRSLRYRFASNRLAGFVSPSVMLRRLILSDKGAFRKDKATA